MLIYIYIYCYVKLTFIIYHYLELSLYILHVNFTIFIIYELYLQFN